MGENEKQGKSQKKRLVALLIMLLVFIVLAIVFVSCRSMSKDRKKDSENSSEESILEDDASTEESVEAVNNQEGNVTSDEKESVESDNSVTESDEADTSELDVGNQDDKLEDTQSSGSNDSEISTSTTESVNASDEEVTQHQHTWVAQYTIVHHEEEGHYEDVLVQEAYDEPVYETHNVCNYCGLDITASGQSVVSHCGTCGEPLSPEDPFYVEGKTTTAGSSYGSIKVQVDTIHHDAVYETQWIVDKAAYDEKVLTGYTCTCGATKSN